MKKFVLGLVALMMFTSSALGAFHLEPYVGYAKGEEETSSGTPDEYTGIGYGARIGYNYLGLLVGGTYDAIGITSKDVTDNTEFDLDYTNMGAFLGYEFPVGLRIWLSYYASAKNEISSGILANAEFSGTGTAFGVGYSIVPMMLAVNLEYKSYSYDEFTFNNQTINLATDAGSSYLFLSVSAPLGF